MREILTSPRQAEIAHDRRVKNIRLSILVSILFVAFIYACAYFSSDSRITINKIKITGTHIISDFDVDSFIKGELSGKYLYLFARGNSMIYPKREIYNSLREKYPSIEELSIYRGDRNTLHVDIKERSASYLYCGAQVPADTEAVGDNCYFINTDGYIFDKAPYFSGNIYFKYYAPIPDTVKVLGQYVFPQDEFHNLARFVDEVTGIGLKPIYLTLDSDNTYSLYLNHTPTNTSPKIVFKKGDDLTLLLNNLTVAMQKPEFANEINSKYATLLYIDLRFKNKVLYKFQ